MSSSASSAFSRREDSLSVSYLCLSHSEQLQQRKKTKFVLANAQGEQLQVKKSNIVGAGQGLFAACHFNPGDTACVYTGENLQTKQAIVLDDKSYLMRL